MRPLWPDLAMGVYSMAVIKRLATAFGLLITVSAITFFMILLVPGDPAATAAGPEATAEQIRETRERLGLDEPLMIQFFHWLSGIFTGDLGSSLQGGIPVSDLIRERFPVTLGLTLFAIVIALAVAIPAAVFAAVRRGSAWDRIVTIGATAGIAVPSFWLGLIFVIVFSLKFGLLPSSGYVPFFDNPAAWLQHTILPALTLAAGAAADITRQLRATMIDVLDQDYIRTATAKGLRPKSVLLKHALKNAGVPAVTMVGLQLAFLLAGSVIVEQIFGVPGIGALAINAVYQRDIPVIQGVVLVAAVAVLLVNFLVDLSYRYFNPKVR